MKIFLYDEQGKFYGETLAQKSPLEVDVWLMPPNCTTIEPPIIPETHEAFFINNEWQLIEKELPPEPFVMPEEPLAPAGHYTYYNTETNEWEILEKPIIYGEQPEYDNIFEYIQINTEVELIDNERVLNYTIYNRPDIEIDIIKNMCTVEARKTFIQFCREYTDDYYIESLADGTPVPEHIVSLRAIKKTEYENYCTNIDSLTTVLELKTLGRLVL